MAVKEREALGKINNYIAARTLESVKREFGLTEVIKLAGNENRIGCSPFVHTAIQNFFGQLSYYPDMKCTKLREQLAKEFEIDGEQLVFGNGSFELISFVAQTFLEKGDESIISVPSFGWYTNVTLQMDAKPVNVPLKNFTVDLQAVYNAITDKTKVIWICNPNNPTGTLLDQKKLLDFIDKVGKDIVIVLDEAYIEYIEGDYLDTTTLITKYDNLILLRTFSKVYGLASFRIGYGIADTDIILKMNKVRPPININALAQEAAVASLGDKEFKKIVQDNNKKSLEFYYSELDKLGLNYVTSNCNFILFDTTKDSVWIENEFLKRGFIIRSGVEFGYPTWVRISIGTWEDNVKVIEILREVLLNT